MINYLKILRMETKITSLMVFLKKLKIKKWIITYFKNLNKKKIVYKMFVKKANFFNKKDPYVKGKVSEN